MRPMIKMLPVLAALALGGCAGVPLPDIQTKVDTTVAQIQSIAVQICRFEPTIATVTRIIATLAGAGEFGTTATAVANSICAAVTAKSVRRGGKGPTFRGVAIRGRFVR